MNKKPIPSLGGVYAATADGRIFSVGRVITVAGHMQKTRTIKERELATRIDIRGYVQCSASFGNKTRHYRVHRLVLEAFDPVEGMEFLDVNHKNGIKTDNTLENLEWLTRGENHRHRYSVLGQKHSMVGKYGAKHHRSIPVTGTAKDGSQVFFDALMDAQRAGFSASKISQCLHGKRRTHGGMQWTISA